MELDVSQLDEGIRDLVVLLRENGFETTDSGDGSKAMDMDCAVDVPHVYMKGDLETAKAESTRLMKLLESHSVLFDGEVTSIEVSYSPVDDICMLAVFGVTDDMLVRPS